MYEDLLILLFGCLYLAALTAFLIFLHKIPVGWRLVAYGVFCSVNFYVAKTLYELEPLNRNILSGHRTLAFFKALEEQLASGNMAMKLLDLPESGPGFWLSLLAGPAFIAGLVCCSRKIRWYSYIILPVAFVLFLFLFAGPEATDRRRDIEEHNELRCRAYALVADKRIQGVTTRQMAELIGAKLRDYHTSYESREDEKESVERILAALEALTPQKNSTKRGPGPSAGK